MQLHWPRVRRAEESGTGSIVTGGLGYDLVVVLGSIWWLGGIFLDGHSHLHGEVPSFFYIHHYIFYAGYLATYGWIVLSMLAGYLRSGDWMVPPGYRLAIYGGVVFGLGGGLDMLWHAAFGFEASTEALLSPTHLLLAVGGILVLSGPLRAAWRRHDDVLDDPLRAVTAIVGAGHTLAVVVLFSSYASPFVKPTGQVFGVPPLGIAAILLQSVILVAAALVVVRRWTLPPGALTLLVLVPYAYLTVMTRDPEFLLPVAAAGLVADALVWYRRPTPNRPLAVRGFAVVVPVVLVGVFWGVIAATRAIPWSVHLWVGSIPLAGLAALLVSYVYTV